MLAIIDVRLDSAWHKTVPTEEEKNKISRNYGTQRWNKPRHQYKYNRPIPPNLMLIELSATHL